MFDLAKNFSPCCRKNLASLGMTHAILKIKYVSILEKINILHCLSLVTQTFFPDKSFDICYDVRVAGSKLYFVVVHILRLRRFAHWQGYVSFDTLYFPVLAKGILGKGGVFVTPPLEDCLGGLTRSSTRSDRIESTWGSCSWHTPWLTGNNGTNVPSCF